MPISRMLSRPMLASMFIADGIDQLRDPGSKAKQAEAVTAPIADRLTFLPKDPETLVRINGAVQLTAGALLALGRFPRLSAILLAGSLVPTTLAEHAFWSETDEHSKAAQQAHFLKNVSVMGGLLLAVSDVKANRRLAHRASRRQEKAQEKALATGRLQGSEDRHEHRHERDGHGDEHDHHLLATAAKLAAAAEAARHLLPDVDRREITAEAGDRLSDVAEKVRLAAGAARHLLPSGT